MIQRIPPATAAVPHTLPEWGPPVLDAFFADLTRSTSPFPCTFGVEAARRGGLRYAFVEDAADPAALLGLRDALTEYLHGYREVGRLTSFVALFRPNSSPAPLEAYARQFWGVLDFLHRHDPLPWPAKVPTDPDDPAWEFCFHGEPVFVVCNTPAHRLRRSRRSAGLVMTFQPRWVFEGIEGHTERGRAARAVIRRRLTNYDAVPPHPSLGDYGDPGNREWMQYFLADVQESPRGGCPLHVRHDAHDERRPR